MHNRSTIHISNALSSNPSQMIQHISYRPGWRRNRATWRVYWAAGRARVRLLERKNCGEASSLRCRGSRRLWRFKKGFGRLQKGCSRSVILYVQFLLYDHLVNRLSVYSTTLSANVIESLNSGPVSYYVIHKTRNLSTIGIADNKMAFVKVRSFRLVGSHRWQANRYDWQCVLDVEL
jgi:hypothetical protein